MVIKVILLFLVFIAVLGMFGRLRFPGQDRLDRLTGRACRACGRPRIGKGPCPCGKDSV